MHFRRRTYLSILLILLLAVLIHFNQGSDSQKHQTHIVDRVPVGFYSRGLKVVQGVQESIANVWDDYFALVGIKKENKKLKDELDFSRLYILSLKERLRIQDQEGTFDQKLESLGWEGVTAPIIGYDPYARSQTAWISVGSDDGVREDQPVITLEGLVGRIVKVLPQASQVLLLVDSHFSVDTINESSRVRALIVGSGNGASVKRYPVLTHLEYLRLGDEIKPGDLFITSGLNPQYPGGIPVGNVLEVEKNRDEEVTEYVVLPTVDLTKMERVIVLTAFKSLEVPLKPTPELAAPTPTPALQP